MQEEQSIEIITDSGEKEFQVRLFSEEGVGLLTTRTKKSYLILDSLDFWYDLIQPKYPPKKKCGCHNEWFYATFHYIPRLGTDDFRQIDLQFTCSYCGKKKRPIPVYLRHSPTKYLLHKPITFCEKPRIKYKYTNYQCYWSHDDLPNFLDFIFNELKLNVYCWFSDHPDHIRQFRKIDHEKALKIITVNHRYLSFYFSPHKLEESRYIELRDERGVHLKNDIWRKEEIIELLAPFVVLGYGLSYSLTFCNQFLVKDKVQSKSPDFEQITNQMTQWLKENFITKRGKRFFDGERAYEKLMKKLNG